MPPVPPLVKEARLELNKGVMEGRGRTDDLITSRSVDLPPPSNNIFIHAHILYIFLGSLVLVPYGHYKAVYTSRTPLHSKLISA